MDYVRPLLRSLSESSNDHDIIDPKLEIIRSEGADIRARKRDGEALEILAEHAKRKKVGPSLMEYALLPFRSVFKMITGGTDDEHEDEVVQKSLSFPGDKKFNFPRPVKDEEDDIIILENDVESEVEKQEVDQLNSSNYSSRAEKSSTRAEILTVEPAITISSVDDCSENEVEIVAEVRCTPKAVFQSPSLQESSDSISNYSTNGLRSFSGSPCPDDSVSRQTTPKSFRLETSSFDRWSRKPRKFQQRKACTDAYEKYLRDYMQNLDKDPMTTNVIQINARDTYKAMLAERDQRMYKMPKQKRIGKLKSNPVHNNYLKRVRNALVRLPADFNLSSTEYTNDVFKNDGDETFDREISLVNITNSEQDYEGRTHDVSGRSSRCSESSNFSSRLEDSVNDIMHKIREVDIQLNEQTTVYDRYKDEVESRKRREIELKETLRITNLSRANDRAEIEERVRQNLELVGLRPPKPKVPAKDEFPTLPEEADDICARAWDRRGDPEEVFVDTAAAKISRKDLATLSGLHWLNDEIINCYLNMIVQRCEKDSNLPKVYAFNTFFFTNIATKGYASVKRWTRKVDIFSYDILLVPVHMHNNHWCLAVVDFPNKKIEYFDSLHGRNSQCLELVKQYLQQESQDKKKTNFPMTDWSLTIRSDCPEQYNGSDCGMFSLKFAEFVSRRREVIFTQQHMPYYRKRMMSHGGSKSDSSASHVKDGIVDLLAGTCGGIANVYAGQPLDTVKVKVQTFPHLYNSWVVCLKDTFKSEGVRGLYAGTIPALAANIAENAVLFSAYGYCQKFVGYAVGHSDPKSMTPLENALSGSLAAVFAATVLCPTELVKCRLQSATEQKIKCTPFSVCRDMWKERGMRGFFVGMTPTLAREVPGYFCFFGAYETCRYMLTQEGQNKDDIGLMKTACSGAIGGMALWTSIFPADVVKSRMQVQGGGKFGEMIVSIAKNEGIRGLYKGLLPTLIRTCVASGCLFVAYEESRKLMHSFF
ncbi:unnamed protein product [Auanema sp. JU1783]|nr:unnamed protein product [Auanema sp. JU1783]